MIIKYFFAGIILFFSQLSFGLDLELTEGINAAIPIGIQSFGQGLGASELKKIVTSDLSLTGQFKLLNSEISQPINYWQRVGVESMISGMVEPVGGRLAVHIELVDVAGQGRVLLSKKYQIDPGQIRALAHHISDEIYQKLTGVRGIFSTKIAYVKVNRGRGQTQYTLDIADVDGSYPRALLISSEPIMSPTWSPDGRSIAYVSFEKKRAQIFSVAVATGQRRLLTDFTGINGAPAWSPDGRYMAVVLSKTGSPKLYSVDLSSGAMKQLTFGPSIDTEPRYSPDGRSILFTSGRSGSPQIYRLILNNGQIIRLTFQGNYNARAELTPDQKKMVMLHREDKQFTIGVQTLGLSGVLSLTNSPMDESPSLAPNGRLVIYATRSSGSGDRGVLSLVSIDGGVSHQLPVQDGDLQDPSWSPYLD